MKIAVTTDNEKIFQNYENCDKYTVVEVEAERIISRYVIEASGLSPSARTDAMKSNRIDIIICGCIGGMSKTALRIYNIEFITEVSGNVNDIIKRYLSGEVIGDADYYL